MICLGQRCQSLTEPAYGLGTVIAIAHKRFTVRFARAGIEQTYSTINPPIQRVVFSAGEKFFDRRGIHHTVIDREEIEGLLYYRCSGNTVCETDIADSIDVASPLSRLTRRSFDRSADFDFRIDSREFLSFIRSHPARGFCGGRIELLPHQLAIVERLSEFFRPRCFLADEVGLGKTIEAALILHYLLVTGRISRALIAVPRALMHQWFIELYRRFSMRATLIDETFLEQDFEAADNPFERGDLFIAAIDDCVSGSPFSQRLSETTWDLLIVDEAHHLVAGSGKRQKGYEVIAAIAYACDGLLLLTATPESLDEETFFALSTLIDPIRFNNLEAFRKQRCRYGAIASLAQSLIDNTVVSDSHKSLLHELLPSIPQSPPNESSINHTVRLLADLAGAGRTLFRTSRSVLTGFPKRTLELISIDIKGKDDAPVDTWIASYIKDHRSEKTLVICGSKERATRLHKLCGKISSAPIALFIETVPLISLDRSAAWFYEQNGACALISSAIGSEGRNFQCADRLILVDLESDPERLEQCIGRIDRIGRTSHVSISIPSVAGSRDDALAQWYHRGLNAFERTCQAGYRIGEKFSKQIEELCTTSPYDSKALESLINTTRKSAQKIEDEMIRGRDRLLEWNAQTAYSTLPAAIAQADANKLLDGYLEKIFDHFGVQSEIAGKNLTRISFDLLTDDAFPIPFAKEEGLLFTTDRSTALSREDALLLSIDHPMLTGAIDLALSSQRGTAACTVFENSGEEGFLLETLFVLETPPSRGPLADRFTLCEHIRIVMDDSGDDVSDIFDRSTLILKEMSSDLLDDDDENRVERLEALFREATMKAEAWARESLKHAQEKLESFARSELSRINSATATIDGEREIEALQASVASVNNLLKNAAVRADAVRIILLKK